MDAINAFCFTVNTLKSILRALSLLVFTQIGV